MSLTEYEHEQPGEQRVAFSRLFDRMEAFEDGLDIGPIVPIDDGSSQEEPTEADLAAVKKEQEAQGAPMGNDDVLANIDADDTIGLYIKEVSQTPLLTADEEVELCQRIEKGKGARESLVYRPSSRQVPKQKRDELRAIVEDGWAARDHLIRANGRLVISIAKKYMNRGVFFLDLIQEGNIGLMRATKKFDYHRGHKFSTYATWWIRQAVSRAIADGSRTIRIPVHMSEKINTILRLRLRMTQSLGREPSIMELAVELDLKPDKVEKMIAISGNPVSLDAPIDDDEASTLGDIIRDDAKSPDAEAHVHLLRGALNKALFDIPPKEALILRLRYGLEDGYSYTLEEVGAKLGVTRERIRQVEKKAISRLRHPSVRRKLRDYLDT